ncbi:hypothetical protein MARI151_50428 [Maribacter litoralis]|uniref:Uncharacterized protein n=1 Tax=Maribacter litoralis TaxID=2059726 RepID=A0A653VBV2_9FLAO|nr:hypothetical protein MARI151_50428 [Maribacter litoralis]
MILNMFQLRLERRKHLSFQGLNTINTMYVFTYLLEIELIMYQIM